MTTEGSAGEVDLENPSPVPTPSNPHDTAAGVKGKKWKAIALSAFLVAAVALAIALGVALGDKGGGDGDSTSSSQNASTGGNDDARAPTAGVVALGDKGGGDSETTSSQIANTVSNDDASAPTITAPYATPSDPKIPAPEAPAEPSPNAEEVAFDVEWLRSSGPLSSRVRIANPGVARGYSSCADLRDDILDALKYYAHSTIMDDRDNGWVRTCDVGEACPRDGACRTGNCTEGRCAEKYWEAGTPSAEPTFGSTPTVGFDLELDDDGPASTGSAPSSIQAEDSFDTNAQVDGVDEADVVKANENHVFAAYGDVLWVWNSTDASEGKMSKTRMPAEERDPDCTDPTPYPTPAAWNNPRTPWPTESFPRPASSPSREPSPVAADAQFSNDAAPDGGVRRRGDSSLPGSGDRTDRRRRASGRWYGTCEPPKPEILALLLSGPRLAAVVSKPEYYWKTHVEGDSESIISDDTIVVRVYDAENIPTDGRPLTLLGEQEIRGRYTSARSIGSKAVVVSESNVNKWLTFQDLDRYKSQYCGLNSTEYEELATETALSMVDSIAEQMINELELQTEGTCDNWFQIAAMQAGNGSEPPDNGDFLDQLVHVSSFDMFSDFAGASGNGPPEIPVDAAAMFSAGSLQTVYASQDFVASVNVGYKYNATSGNWDSATFIQGFDIGGDKPKPFSYARVQGRPLNQYSLDLYDGHLRVVTTQSAWWPDRWTENKLWVLKVPERGPEVTVTNPEMELTGETGHLGKPNEDVFAVRFMGDLAYVVTFLNTDPFYVLNVTNHTNPIVIGELQIPGFSSYLHPIQINGVKMMIGVGEQDRGGKISLFDVSDPMNPTENATYLLGPDSYSSATSDFYSFRYLPLNQKLILPKSKWTRRPEGNFDGFGVYDVDLGGIAPSYEIQHADSSQIFSWCGYDARMPARSLVFKSQLTSILSHSVISTDLATGSRNWNVSLDEGLDKTECSGYFW